MERGPRLSQRTMRENQGAPARTSATYGLHTATRSAAGKAARTARIAGVAITTSPIQFGKKSAILRTSRRLHAFDEPCRRKPLAEFHTVTAAAEIDAAHLPAMSFPHHRGTLFGLEAAPRAAARRMITGASRLMRSAVPQMYRSSDTPATTSTCWGGHGCTSSTRAAGILAPSHPA